jgi:hypothetical protein
MSVQTLPETAPGTAAEFELSFAEDDRQLLSDLRFRVEQQQSGYDVATQTMRPAPEIAADMRERYSVPELRQLKSTLQERGTFDIPMTTGVITVDGEKRQLPLVAATDTETSHGDMSSMLYLRDHIQTARSYLELNRHAPDQHREQGALGKQLLMGALDLMSTPRQLERFAQVIAKGEEAGQEDWPHISLLFRDLMGEDPNGWRNIQDSFQMLAHLALDSLECGELVVSDLRDSHKQFLSSLVPFLAAVGYPNYPNSGSWEEFAATRTSVMAVETAMLHKMHRLLTGEQAERFAFLRGDYRGSNAGFNQALHAMLQQGLEEVGSRLPYETPWDDPSGITYREADAALTYVLMYDLPELLAASNIPIGPNQDILSSEAIEKLILDQLARLDDPITGGMVRYHNDSYQRTNFHTRTTQTAITGVKRRVTAQAAITGQQPDLVMKQAMRDQVVEPGREAVWTHPLGQLSAWAARRSLQTSQAGNLLAAQHYRNLSTRFLNRQLSLITGSDQYHAVLQSDGSYAVQPVPDFKLPECYITYRDGQGEYIVASPHTPLNWATASLYESVGLLLATTEQATAQQLGNASFVLTSGTKIQAPAA